MLGAPWEPRVPPRCQVNPRGAYSAPESFTGLWRWHSTASPDHALCPSLITNLPSMQQSDLWRDQGINPNISKVRQEARTSADQEIWQVNLSYSFLISPSRESEAGSPSQIVIPLIHCISSSPVLTCYTYNPPPTPKQALSYIISH